MYLNKQKDLLCVAQRGTIKKERDQCVEGYPFNILYTNSEMERKINKSPSPHRARIVAKGYKKALVYQKGIH